jgi:cytochrome c-type biogenesis protein CcmF
MGFTQFLKYKKTSMGEFWKRILVSVGVSLLLTGLLAYVVGLSDLMLLLLMFASLFAVIGNADYLFRVLKGKMPKAGPSIAHIGFGLVLLGALISTGKQEFISQNTSAFDLGKDFPNKENILLARNDTVKMGDYHVSYRGDSTAGINIYYNVEYFKKDKQGRYSKEFTLHPFIQTNPRMGNVAEPATKHFIHKDIFTHVTYAKVETPEEKVKTKDGWQDPQDYQLRQGDTVFTSNAMVILEGLENNVDKAKYKLEEADIAVGAKLKVMGLNGDVGSVMPVYIIRGFSTASIDTVMASKGLQFSLWKIDPGKETFHIRIAEKTTNAGDFIILKAIVFPAINVLWIGCILMAIGTGLAVWNRTRKSAKTLAAD